MRRARGYAAEPPITGLTASEERSKRLYSQAPAIVSFEVYNGCLLEFNSKIVYNKVNEECCYL